MTLGGIHAFQGVTSSERKTPSVLQVMVRVRVRVICFASFPDFGVSSLYSYLAVVHFSTCASGEIDPHCVTDSAPSRTFAGI